MGRLLAFLASLVIAIPVRLFGAWVLSKYWQRFAVEHLGWRPISYLACVSILLLAGFLTMGTDLQLGLIRNRQLEGEDDLSGFRDLVTYFVMYGVIGYPLMLLIGTWEGFVRHVEVCFGPRWGRR